MLLNIISDTPIEPNWMSMHLEKISSHYSAECGTYFHEKYHEFTIKSSIRTLKFASSSNTRVKKNMQHLKCKSFTEYRRLRAGYCGITSIISQRYLPYQIFWTVLFWVRLAICVECAKVSKGYCLKLK